MSPNLTLAYNGSRSTQGHSLKNVVVLPYTMLHTKFQGHWSIGSGEEVFLRFLPYMGMAAMLVI